MQLGDELPAPLLGLLDLGHGAGVGSLPQLGGQGAQADVVAGLPLVVEALHGFGLQLCHMERTNKDDYSKFWLRLSLILFLLA